jgi:AcrR family transcriptional regulator
MLGIMPQQPGARPANRPSRRPDILRAAVDLLSVQLPDAISVADITTHAGMTPAAFYYHFSGKDELLNEVVSTFAQTWAAEVTARLEAVRVAADVPGVMTSIVGWLDENERPATVYFVTSIAATEQAEQTRRQTRVALQDAAIAAMRRAWPAGTSAETAVGGIALITLVEVVARSRLQLDESYRSLGPVRFRQAAAALARGLVERAS